MPTLPSGSSNRSTRPLPLTLSSSASASPRTPKAPSRFASLPRIAGSAPEIFADVLQLTEELAAADPQSAWRCTEPSDPDTYQHMAVRCGLRRAVEQTLDKADAGSALFASEPTFVNGYSVLVMVCINRARYESHYRLDRDFVQKIQLRYSVGRSLIESTIRAFLDALAEKLQQPDPGRDIFLIRDNDAVRRAAAKQLMRGPAWAGGDLMGLGNIYEICNTISLQNYEGAEGAGKLIFVRKDHPSIKVDLQLKTPVPIRSFGAIRKLLQMASRKLSLFCDSRDVYGLGTVGEYDGVSEDLFVVQFLKRLTRYRQIRASECCYTILPLAKVGQAISNAISCCAMMIASCQGPNGKRARNPTVNCAWSDSMVQ